jgi:hypothetical protein
LFCFVSDDNKRWILPHMLSYWVGAAMVAGGGSWCRSYDGFIPCLNNETMSIGCLLHVQTEAYRGVYIMHYIGLAWLVSHWLLDGMQLWSWVVSRTADGPRRGARCRLLFSSFDARSPVYFGIILVCVVIVSITWLFIFDWSTDNGLTALGAVLIAEITLTGLISAALLRLAPTPLEGVQGASLPSAGTPASVSHDSDKMIDR